MKKNGFTLIELLAVIVILAIIALIATPIILGIINDAREESNERSVELYASAVRNAVAAYQLTGTTAPKSFSDLDIQYDGTVECTTQELYADGSFYLDKCKVNGSEKEYSYGTKQPSCSIKKQDASKYSKGDVVTCYLGEKSDKFYVIADANTDALTIQMLTEKNIHITEYNQSDNAGTIAFSSADYWSGSGSSYPAYIYNDNSLLYPIVEGYVSYLNEHLTEDSIGSLLTLSQAEDLGCIRDNASCAPGVNGGGTAPEWLYSTTYWLGSTYNGLNLEYIEFGGNFYNSYFTNNNGVRPVITISTSDIQ